MCPVQKPLWRPAAAFTNLAPVWSAALARAALPGRSSTIFYFPWHWFGYCQGFHITDIFCVREGKGWQHVLCSLFTATRCAVVNHTLLSCFPSKDTARCFTPVFREEGMWGEGKTSETFAAALTPDEHTLGTSALGCERSDFLPQNRNKRNSLIAESPPDWRNCLFHCVCHAVI